MSTLVEQIKQGLSALRSGHSEQAYEALKSAAKDPSLVAADDLQDVRARVCSLYAQACLDSGRLEQAQEAVRVAVGVTRALGDREGLAAVRTLQDQIVAALAQVQQQAAALQSQAALAAKPTSALLADLDDPEERAERLLEKAAATLSLHGPDGVEVLATAALAESPTPRIQVLARLTLAQALPAQAASQVLEALGVAQKANDPTLIGAVARTANQCGVTLPEQQGPCV